MMLRAPNAKRPAGAEPFRENLEVLLCVRNYMRSNIKFNL